MLLSIITHHRNDSYCGDNLGRANVCLTKWCQNIDELGSDNVEIVCCDWGSDVPLKDILVANKHLKYITVNKAIAKTAEGDSNYSSSHATNVATRRASGKYFLYLDTDVYFKVETLNKLIKCLCDGHIGSDNLETSYYWGSRFHVPKSFNSSRPSIPIIDDYINRHHSELKCDVVNGNNFQGAATALLTTKDMWFAVRGFNEQLKYWGANDLDIDVRLRMLYRYGGDLMHHEMMFYHLEHYETRNREKENPRRANIYIRPSQPVVNNENWGLGNIDL